MTAHRRPAGAVERAWRTDLPGPATCLHAARFAGVVAARRELDREIRTARGPWRDHRVDVARRALLAAVAECLT